MRTLTIKLFNPILAMNALCRGKYKALDTKPTTSKKTTIRTTNFFGDAMADYEAAKDCNIDFIAVGNGWKEYNFTCETVGNIVDFNDLL